MAFLKSKHLLRINQLVKQSTLIRHFSSNKQFDYQAFEEEIRKERQKNKNQHKSFNNQDLG